VIAPDEMPKVMPPMAKKPIKNKTLNKGRDKPVELAIPDSTPPNIFLFKSLFMVSVNKF
ncbi:MAG: hypothetical protein RLZZ60_1548, partial [Bacteroidota bacterium]